MENNSALIGAVKGQFLCPIIFFNNGVYTCRYRWYLEKVFSVADAFIPNLLLNNQVYLNESAHTTCYAFM